MNTLRTLLIVLGLSGCAGIDDGRPVRVGFEAALVNALVTKYQDPVAFHVADEAGRDHVVDEILWLIDRNYFAFESDFFRATATFGTVTDLAVLGLGIAGTQGVSEGVGQLLAGISAGVSGARISVQKNFLAEETQLAVIAKMRAGRSRERLRIRENQQRPLSEYSMARALSDIEGYYTAGTIVGALRSIVTDSGIEVRQAEAAVREVERPIPLDLRPTTP